MPKLQDNKFNQPLKQGNAKDHSEQTEKMKQKNTWQKNKQGSGLAAAQSNRSSTAA